MHLFLFCLVLSNYHVLDDLLEVFLRHKRQPILMPMIRIVMELVPSQVLTRSSHQSSLSLALSIFIHPSLVFMSVPKSALPSFERFWFHIAGSMCGLLHGSGILRQGDDAEHEIHSIVLPFAPTRRDLFFACSLAPPPICHPTGVLARGLRLRVQAAHP